MVVGEAPRELELVGSAEHPFLTQAEGMTVSATLISRSSFPSPDSVVVNLQQSR